MHRELTLLYLDVFRFYDASRSGLIGAFRKLGIRVIIANFPFHHLSQQNEICEDLISLLEKSGYEIDAVISMNVAGVSDPFRHFSSAKSITHVLWFIDSPYLFTNLSGVNFTKIFAASRDFNQHPEVSNAHWLPFAGYSPRKPDRISEANIGFLGTLLPMAHYITKFRRGLIGSKSGHVIPDGEYVERVCQPSFTLDETWTTVDKEPMPAAEILNYVSSHHRTLNLSYFGDLGLEITGPANWQTELWAVAPHLLKNFKAGSVSSENAMAEYLSRYRVCLNIFHLQNISGGPNFRSMDAASHYIPCLSQFNAGCAELFPEDVAAVYYRNSDDGRYKAKCLLNDQSLREKIAHNAAEIVNTGHTFEKRARELCNHLNLKIPTETTIASLIYLHSPGGVWERSHSTETQIVSGRDVTIAQPSLPAPVKSAKTVTIAQSSSPVSTAPKKRRPMWRRWARSVRKRVPFLSYDAQN